MREIELPAGTFDHEDTGGSGPVVVPVGGLANDGSLWRASCATTTAARYRRSRSALIDG